MRLYVMRKPGKQAVTYSSYMHPTSLRNSSTSGDRLVENAFCLTVYKAVIYSVNSKDSRRDSVSKRNPSINAVS